ncbi:MAG: TonB-dependent receptor plug domain-containing protein, partial [Bacteroidales bacterium]|nr:TonB-dependent receptor plug domain-containing protein [Bacteroidales bacterium]
MKRLIQTVAAVLLATLASSAQNSGKTDITGIIRDASDGSPIAGATILTKGQTGSFISGTTTDAKGEFTLKINPKTETVIQASFLGYAAVAQPIDSRTRIEIMLEPTSEMIEKSVVTALGMDRKEKVLNYSHQGVDATSLSENRTTDFISALQGRVAGLQIASAGTNTGSSGIVIRGYASATGDNNAIFVVDGVIMENGAVGGESGGIDFGNAMGDINPDDIADIQVLKGPNATALYGSRAANGVIMITTKRSDGNQKIKVSYGNNTTFQQIAEYPEYQNTFGVGMDLSIQTKNIMELPNPITGGRYRSWGPMMLGQPYIAID